jgi:hypothetical protein
MRRQPRDRAQVEPTVREHLEQHGMAVRGASRGDAQVSLGLRQVQPLGAEGEHRRARLPRIEPPAVDLSDMEDEIDLGVARPRDESGETLQQLVVRQ